VGAGSNGGFEVFIQRVPVNEGEERWSKLPAPDGGTVFETHEEASKAARPYVDEVTVIRCVIFRRIVVEEMNGAGKTKLKNIIGGGPPQDGLRAVAKKDGTISINTRRD